MSIKHLEKIVNRLIYDIELVNETPLYVGAPSEEGLTRDFLKIVINNETYAVIPETSLKGVLRKEASRIARTIPSIKTITEEHIRLKEIAQDTDVSEAEIFRHENQCPLCRLFGGSFFAGKIIIHAALSTEPLGTMDIHRKMGVGIDRKTQTAKEKQLYRLLSIRPGKTFRTRIIINNPTNTERQIIEALFKNIEKIGITFGGRKTIGYGYFKAKISKNEQELVNLYR